MLYYPQIVSHIGVCMPSTSTAQPTTPKPVGSSLALGALAVAFAALFLPFILGIFVLFTAPGGLAAIIIASISLVKKYPGKPYAITAIVVASIALCFTPYFLFTSLFSTGFLHSPLGIW